MNFLRFLCVIGALALTSCGGSGSGSGGGSGGGGCCAGYLFSITLTHQGDFTQGQQKATYTVIVKNIGGDIDMTQRYLQEQLPSGLTLVSMAGDGWTCTNPLPSSSYPGCVRSDSLGAGGQYPAITVTVNVASNATSPQINQVTSSYGGQASDSTTILPVNAGLATVATSVPFPIFAGGPAQTIAITVTNDSASDVPAPTLTVDANTGAACTALTCGTLGPVSGTGGSGSYTVPYTPPPTLAAQIIPTIVVSSSLPGSFAATDFIEVDPPGILLTIDGLGTIPVGSAQRTLTATVYNDVANAGVVLSPMTASGYACSNLLANSCGSLGIPVKSTNGTTTTATFTYTPPTSLPSAPYDRPRIAATSVADNTQTTWTQFLLASSVVRTGLGIPRYRKFNSALASPGAAAMTVAANIGNDTGSSRTVDWTLTAGGVNCAPACGTLGTAAATGNGAAVSSAVTYTPPSSVPTVAAQLTPTITATSVDSPSATDNFTFTIIDGTCGAGNNGILNGQYAFLLRGGGANAGHTALIGSFTANGAGGITGGLFDLNTSTGPSTGLTLTAASSSYSVGSDNRVCLTLADSVGDVLTFRAGVGTLVGGVATQGRIIRFDGRYPQYARQSGVLMKQDPPPFAASKISGNYALGLAGVDSNGGPLASAGVFTANGVSDLSNITLDVNDAGSPSGNLTGGSGSYTVAASGRGTATTTIAAPGGVATTNFILYMISSSEILAMSSDSLLAGKSIQSGEFRKQIAGTFSPTALDNGGYISYIEGLDTSNGGNDTQIVQATVTTNGSATLTIDENNNGTLLPELTQNVVLNIAPNGRMTSTGAPVFYLIDSISGFIVSADALPSYGFVEKQTGGPFSTASINGAFFFGGEGPTTGSSYDSGEANFDGLGSVLGTDDGSGKNGLTREVISPATWGAYSFTSTSTPPGKGTVGPNSIAYVISGSKVVFMSTGQQPKLVIVQK